MKSFSRGQFLLLCCDIVSILFAYYTALYLYFAGVIPEIYLNYFFHIIIPVLMVYMILFLSFGLYKQLWRYASLREMLEIIKAVTLGTVLIWGFTGALQLFFFPPYVVFFAWLLLMNLTGGIRLLLRHYQQNHESIFYNAVNQAGAQDKQKRVLIVGAGDAGAMVIDELRKHRELNYKIVGFVDDDPLKLGRQLKGATVLGVCSDLRRLISEYDVHEIIIAIPSASGDVIRTIVEENCDSGVKIKTLPGVFEIIDEQVHVNQLREVQVEDLLRREAVEINSDEISDYIQGRTVLVTGGAGSIGSVLCKQLINFDPEKIVILDRNENSIFDLSRELKRSYPDNEFFTVVGDVQDQDKLESVFRNFDPQVVFHAAAHKHVPLMEYDAEEAVKNNIFGTLNLAEAADRFEVEKFVMISTDKAVNPTSVMGASKRIAEMIIEKMNEQSTTNYNAVRFGNVLGSKGSVIPLFKRQISEGGPVTVTHKEVKRYFMTIPEAVQLVLQAVALGDGGEVFVLDMGEPVNILDLAHDLIRLSGLQPGRDIEIKFTGLRPGEKLYEEMHLREENTERTRHEKIYVAHLHSVKSEIFDEKLAELEKVVKRPDPGEIVRRLFKDLIPTYNPSFLVRADDLSREAVEEIAAGSQRGQE